MTYTGNDHARQARSYSASASAATRDAEREASKAAECYGTASLAADYARQVTSRYDVRWGDGFASPADLEERVRSWTRMGDSYLRMSTSATESAEHYRELAARYRELAARRAERMAV
jgi:hypothetical protein